MCTPWHPIDNQDRGFLLFVFIFFFFTYCKRKNRCTM